MTRTLQHSKQRKGRPQPANFQVDQWTAFSFPLFTLVVITGYDHSGEMGHMLWEIRDRELYEKEQLAQPRRTWAALFSLKIWRKGKIPWAIRRPGATVGRAVL
ncbi:hypothetical protein [uncultured Oscillibacter sp.]|uniref:hypothetical protein n=1 Tax=uncultured Oscillibacter sp. TaxID=876091 RepID=UPI00261E7507|nr:hypothetical protein [uncultured Oscillibacter sp.]